MNKQKQQEHELFVSVLRRVAGLLDRGERQIQHVAAKYKLYAPHDDASDG